MAMNPLPPQAYTQQTLKEAYAWLMNQQENIRELATTTDILVSLYLKAQRQGVESLERPSIQNFKNELRNLAGMMGELEQKTPPPPTKTQNLTTQTLQEKTQTPELAIQNKKDSATNEKNENSIDQISKFELDGQSKMMIREVKELYNFNTEADALRFLIALGHNQLQKLAK